MLARVHRWGWKDQPTALPHRAQTPSGWEQLLTGQVPAMSSYIASFATDAVLETYLELWGAIDWAVMSEKAERDCSLKWMNNPEAIQMLREVGLSLVSLTSLFARILSHFSHAMQMRTASASWGPAACALPHDLTLLHGDFHKGNILYKQQGSGSEPEVCIVDWQNYGLGHPCWVRHFVAFSGVFPTDKCRRCYPSSIESSTNQGQNDRSSSTALCWVVLSRQTMTRYSRSTTQVWWSWAGRPPSDHPGNRPVYESCNLLLFTCMGQFTQMSCPEYM